MKYKKFVGLEIGEREYSFVELEGDLKSGFQVNYFHSEEIPLLTLPGAEKIQERVIDWELLINQIKKEFRERKLSSGAVTVTLPESYYNFFLLSLPPVKGKDLSPLLEKEVKKIHPLKENVKYELGYMLLGERRVRSINVLAVLIEQDRLREFHNNFNVLDVRPSVYSIKPLSLYSLLIHFYPQLKNIILVDIGKETASILFIRNGQLQFIRNMYLTLGNIETALSKSLLVPIDVAREFIHKYGLDFDNYPQDEQGRRFKSYIISFLNRFKSELQRSILFYQEKIAGGQKISKIYLCGSALRIKSVDEVFRSELKLDAELLPLPEKLNFQAEVEEYKQKFAIYASAVGCCLLPFLKEKINLVPKKERKKISKNVYFMIALGFIILDILILYSSIGYKKKLSSLKTELQQLDKVLKAFSPDLEKNYHKVDQKRAEIADLEEKFITAQRPHFNWKQLFLTFAKIVGKEVLITDFRIFFDESENMHFEIQGEYKGTYPDAQLTLRKLRLGLEESEYFSGVDFTIFRGGEVKIGEVKVFPFKINGLIEPGVLKKEEL
jgi:Tfp pilus assembly PilM family ATPase